MWRLRITILFVIIIITGGVPSSYLYGQSTAGSGIQVPSQELPLKIAQFFTPPPEYSENYGAYKSPLQFYDGHPVKSVDEWKLRRQEILSTWNSIMGAWPPLLKEPAIQYLKKETIENFTRQEVQIEITPDHQTIKGYLMIPTGDKPFPAVIVVYYEPETGAGMGKELRDFGYQLAKRGFVTLSVGMQPSLYYPSKENAELQPLSALAYTAANCCNAAANLPAVDPQRIGITGHSYGGKWAMFASCLYEKFACAAWSDPGIVFDEIRPNVNYWEPWYLGYEKTITRQPGIPSPQNPRTGAYKQLFEKGYDLHELQALMAPRPFLVSGGSEDQPERWKALNHAIAVNRFLGFENRVAMTNRQDHTPTLESNEQIYLFFEHFLKK